MSLGVNSLNSVGRVYSFEEPTIPLIIPLRTTIVETELIIDASAGDKTITVADPTGIVTGQIATLYNSSSFYFGKVLGVAGSVITLDTPLDRDYSIGDFTDYGSDNLAVNGSVTPVEFNARSIRPGVQSTADITRIIMKMTTTGVPDFGKFGDITGGIENGIVFRKIDGLHQNIFNVKNNGEFAGIAYDLTVYEAGQPPAGVNGLGVRLTFGGANRMGAPISVKAGENLQMLVQDDLSTILSFRAFVEGHISPIL